MAGRLSRKHGHGDGTITDVARSVVPAGQVVVGNRQCLLKCGVSLDAVEPLAKEIEVCVTRQYHELLRRGTDGCQYSTSL
jgi:hypothetical protein